MIGAWSSVIHVFYTLCMGVALIIWHRPIADLLFSIRQTIFPSSRTRPSPVTGCAFAVVGAVFAVTGAAILIDFAVVLIRDHLRH